MTEIQSVTVCRGGIDGEKGGKRAVVGRSGRLNGYSLIEVMKKLFDSVRRLVYVVD